MQVHAGNTDGREDWHDLCCVMAMHIGSPLCLLDCEVHRQLWPNVAFWDKDLCAPSMGAGNRRCWKETDRVDWIVWKRDMKETRRQVHRHPRGRGDMVTLAMNLALCLQQKTRRRPVPWQCQRVTIAEHVFCRRCQDI